MEVSGQLHAPVALPSVTNKGCIPCCVDSIKKQNKLSYISNSYTQISSKTTIYGTNVPPLIPPSAMLLLQFVAK